MSGMLTRSFIRTFSTQGLKVVNNVAKQQFTVSIHEALATIDYKEIDKNITYISTDVPKEFQGKGVGKLLAKHAFDYAQDKKLNVICKCHFLAKFFEDNIDSYKGLKVMINLD